MTQAIDTDFADMSNPARKRYSLSLVKQGKKQFYTLTMHSEVLAETCMVSTRKEDPVLGFQRELDSKRALEIANYIDNAECTIPNSIVLSAQPSAELKIVGKGKTLEFNYVPGAFLILDGQHRVYGFSMAKTSLRVPVVIYNGLSRTEETRLFIDINTNQKPVPPQLLLDIKRLADIESESEGTLRDIFDFFAEDSESTLAGYMAAHESTKGRITRVTFNRALKPLMKYFSGRSAYDTYLILNAYLSAISTEILKRTPEPHLFKPVVFTAFMLMFGTVAQRVVDKFGSKFTAENFQVIVEPIISSTQLNKLSKPGSSAPALRKYFETLSSGNLTI